MSAEFTPFKPSTHIWTREWINTRRLLPMRPPIKGPRSLTALCMETICQNASQVPELDPSHHPNISKYLKKIYYEIEHRYGLNFHAWKAFLKVMKSMKSGSIPLASWLLTLHSCRTDGPYTRIIAPLTSPRVEFITHLIISGGTMIDEQEFMSLADMPNLGVLEIHRPWRDCPVIPLMRVTDRLIRAVCERSENPFPLLRALRLWGSVEVTKDCLDSLAILPSLVFLDTREESRAFMGQKTWMSVKSEYWIPGGNLDRVLTDIIENSGHSGDVEPALPENTYPYLLDSYMPRLIYSSRGRVYRSTDTSDPPLTFPQSIIELAKQDRLNNLASNQITIDTTCLNNKYAHWGIMAWTSSGDGNSLDCDLNKVDPKFDPKQERVYTELSSVKVPLPPRPFVTVCTGHMEDIAGVPSLHSNRTPLVHRYVFRRAYRDIEGHRARLKQQAEAQKAALAKKTRPENHDSKPLRKKVRLDDMLKDLHA